MELGGRLAGLVEAGAHRTLAEKAFGTLHGAIVGGVLVPGERLPIEELAAALGMSPMPIREALRRLDAAGLVEHIPHRGARVTELSVADLAEVYDVRLALELPAIRGAAERLDASGDDAATRALERHAAAIRRRDHAEALRAHTDFHFALYRAAGSSWLMRSIAPAWESAERYRVATVGKKKGYLKSRIGEHERILTACREHQPEVAEAELWNHLALTANAVANEMGARDLYEPRAVPTRTRARRSAGKTRK